MTRDEYERIVYRTASVEDGRTIALAVTNSVLIEAAAPLPWPDEVTDLIDVALVSSDGPVRWLVPIRSIDAVVVYPAVRP